MSILLEIGALIGALALYALLSHTDQIKNAIRSLDPESDSSESKDGEERES